MSFHRISFLFEKNRRLFWPVLLGLCLALCPVLSAGTAPRISVSIDPSIMKEPVSGRIILLLSRSERFRPGENGTPVFGLNVDGLVPGLPVVIDDRAFGYPVRRLSDIPNGEYFVQVFLNIYTTFKRSDGHIVKLHMDRGEGQNWRRSPGNLFSKPEKVVIEPGKSEPAHLVLTEIVPEIEPYKDTKWLKHMRIQSKLLTEFWGRPMFIGANILLPRDYYENPEALYPVQYIQGHFPRGRAGRFREDPESEAYRLWAAADAPRFLQVTFEHACPYYDDSYGVNSENCGPYGDAIITELIPEVERRFRAIGKPWARVLSGGSTGGWIALALQIFYPDFFGGVWAFCPDPVDFRKYQIVDLYADSSAYFVEYEWIKVPRGGSRDTSGNIRYTMEQECLYEEAIGDRCRSGGQWAIWNAVFAPVGRDGYPMPFWDPLTGEIDKSVVSRAGDRYDLRRYLEKNWKEIGPLLEGKIRVYVGRMDNFYLNEACYLLEDFLTGAENPRFGGEFQYGARGRHGWSPFQGDEMLRDMAEHIRKNRKD